jgi:hypothetical protein
MDILSVFITPWAKPTACQCAIHDGGALHHLGIEAGMIQAGKMFGDDVGRQRPHRLGVSGIVEMLEMPEADMAGRQAGDHRAGLRRLAHHGLARGDQRQRAAGGDA